MFYSTSESFNLLNDLLIVNDFLEVTKGLTCGLSQYCFLFFEMEATISSDFSVCPCLDLGKRSVCSLPILEQGCGKCLNTIVFLASPMKHRK